MQKNSLLSSIIYAKELFLIYLKMKIIVWNLHKFNFYGLTFLKKLLRVTEIGWIQFHVDVALSLNIDVIKYSFSHVSQ